MQLDPLLGILTGAFGAALLGLLGAWVQAGREHRRWVRAERLKIYRIFMDQAESTPGGDGSLADWDRYIDALSPAFASIELVGPDTVADAGREHFVAAMEYRAALRMTRLTEVANVSDHQVLDDAWDRLKRATQRQVITRREYSLAVRAALGFSSTSSPRRALRLRVASIRSRFSPSRSAASRK